jgi:hypothetical protein
MTEKTDKTETKINYGKEFITVLDCSTELLDYVSAPLNNIRSFSQQLRTTPQRIGFLGYRSNPVYENAKTALSTGIANLKGSAKHVLREFHNKNKKYIGLTSQESVERDGYNCSIGMNVGNASISGHIWLPPFPMEVSLNGTFNLKPSMLLDSLKSLKDIGVGSFEIKPLEDMQYRPPSTVILPTNMLSDRKLGEIIEGLDDDVCAELGLREYNVESNFFSQIVFRPKEAENVNIRYRAEKALPKKEKDWLEESVNIITGFNLKPSSS